CLFSHALTPYIQFLTPTFFWGFRVETRSLLFKLPEGICNTIRCIDMLFTPRSPEVSDSRRVTKRNKRGRNSGREYITEENLHLQTEQRLGMLMTCGSIKYSLSFSTHCKS